MKPEGSSRPHGATPSHAAVRLFEGARRFSVDPDPKVLFLLSAAPWQVFNLVARCVEDAALGRCHRDRRSM
jgi:hypothetical protein